MRHRERSLPGNFSNSETVMAARKCLVVFYSWSGTTRKVAQALAAELRCDCEEIVETRARRGFLAYTRSIHEAAQRRPAPIAPTKHNPSSYDLVIVGTPVWAWSVSSPVRAYLAANAQSLPQVAFFCTFGGRGEKSTFAQMQAICGKPPIGTIGFFARDVLSGQFLTRLKAFAASLF